MEQETTALWTPSMDEAKKRGLNVIHKPVTGTSRRVARILFAALAAATAWGWYAELPELTYAKGRLVPSSNPRPVEHPDGGVLDEILVREGRFVEAGTPVARLSANLLTEEQGRLNVREAALSRDTARLQSVISVISGKLSSSAARGQLEPGHRLLAQLDAFEASRARHRARISELERALEIRQQILGNARRREETFAIEQSAALALHGKGLLSTTAMSRLSAQQLEIEGDRLRAFAALADGERNLHEARRQEQEFVAGIKDTLMSELETEEEELALVLQASADNAARQQRLTILSSVPGIVQKLHFSGPGEVVAPGEPIAEILPTQDRLIAEVEIQPQDIGHVAIGDPVELKSTTFDARQYGVQAGEVFEISPNSRLNERNEAYFDVRIALIDETADAENLSSRLSAGMEVNAAIRTGERTVLDYILSPIADPISRAFHER
ncbi:HlyD family type I secretion periplasmic adaptor subunit [Leisingera sp. F5]|uniref:HlyD family type I secretion periplasmic adaptor subunit n=1 Tax=Leisingera sp. F5 TaxID=1813816 RepID=UPI000A70592E|nr:HlyD family type I secretion periplasmic adaptor subunit [Leisingera sp. F5]